MSIYIQGAQSLLYSHQVLLTSREARLGNFHDPAILPRHVARKAPLIVADSLCFSAGKLNATNQNEDFLPVPDRLGTTKSLAPEVRKSRYLSREITA
jgi:hypothetical protein